MELCLSTYIRNQMHMHAEIYIMSYIICLNKRLRLIHQLEALINSLILKKRREKGNNTKTNITSTTYNQKQSNPNMYTKMLREFRSKLQLMIGIRYVQLQTCFKSCKLRPRSFCCPCFKAAPLISLSIDGIVWHA